MPQILSPKDKPRNLPNTVQEKPKNVNSFDMLSLGQKVATESEIVDSL